MKQLWILGVMVLALAGCGQKAASQPSSASSSTASSKQVTYTKEEYAMAAFAQSKGGEAIATSQLRVQKRGDDWFIGDQSSDTQGLTITVAAKQVQTVDGDGAKLSYTKAELQPLLKKHHLTYDADIKLGKSQEETAQASVQSSSSAPSETTASATSSSATDSGVDMQNLTTDQVKDWIMRNIAQYAPDAYDIGNNADPNIFSWQTSKDDQGQLVVSLAEDHEYMNDHYGANDDTSVAPAVAEFTITSDGELTVKPFGTVGMAMYQAITGDDAPSGSDEQATVASNFDE